MTDSSTPERRAEIAAWIGPRPSLAAWLRVASRGLSGSTWTADVQDDFHASIAAVATEVAPSDPQNYEGGDAKQWMIRWCFHYLPEAEAIRDYERSDPRRDTTAHVAFRALDPLLIATGLRDGWSDALLAAAHQEPWDTREVLDLIARGHAEQVITLAALDDRPPRDVTNWVYRGRED